MSKLILSSLVTLFMVSPGSAYACSVCFGAPGDKMTQGLVAGIYLLLGVTGFVLSCFIAFIVYLRRRGQAAQ